MTPREIVQELDRHIIGQHAAKRAVAIALRNRWRRMQLDPEHARRGDAEEHPDDRPHRRRQDRDRAPPGDAGQRAVRQGRGDALHRGRLRRQGRRTDHPRPRRHRGQAVPRAGQARACARRPRNAPRTASSTRCCRGAQAATVFGFTRRREARAIRTSTRRRQRHPRQAAQAAAQRRAGRARDRARNRGERRRRHHGAAGHGGDGPAAAADVLAGRRRQDPQPHADDQGRAPAC